MKIFAVKDYLEIKEVFKHETKAREYAEKHNSEEAFLNIPIPLRKSYPRYRVVRYENVRSLALDFAQQYVKTQDIKDKITYFRNEEIRIQEKEARIKTDINRVTSEEEDAFLKEIENYKTDKIKFNIQ